MQSLDVERSEIQFGLTTIAFDVRRSARRKTVALAVDHAGELTVTAPLDVPLARLDAVVRAKAPWVAERVKCASDRPPPPCSREFVTGETVRYLGRHYRLKVARRSASAREEGAALLGGWLVVAAGPAPDPRVVRRIVAGWLRQRAERYLQQRLGAIAARHKIDVPTMVVGEQKARWGSCDARGTLRINWRIVQAPITLIDYVLLHETTHVAHPSHGRAFWAALGRRMPDYEERRDRLRALGAELIW